MISKKQPGVLRRFLLFKLNYFCNGCPKSALRGAKLIFKWFYGLHFAGKNVLIQMACMCEKVLNVPVKPNFLHGKPI